MVKPYGVLPLTSIYYAETRLSGMGSQWDTRDPAALLHARLRQLFSLPSGTAGTNLTRTARYAGENREPLQS